MREPTQISTGSGGSPWLRWVLFVSLAVNFLILGLVIGAMVLRGPGHGDRARGAEALAPRSFVAAINADDRPALLERLRQSVPGPDRARMRQDLRAILETIRANEFTPEPFVAILDRHRVSGNLRQEAGARILADYLAGLGPEARRAYADRLEHALRRRREHR